MKGEKQGVRKWLMAGMALFLASGVPARASVATDAAIVRSAMNSGAFKTYLMDDAVKVASKDGVVTLSGTVSSKAHHALAEETVENIPGVRKVNNNLALKGEQAEGNSDSWIGTKVKTTLLFHRNVNGFKTQVDVKDGVVTLSGVSESAAQRELSAEYAMDVEGVKSVDNKMSVVEPAEKPKGAVSEKIDDASITAQVKLVLLYHRSTSALGTNVRTDNGVVMLDGKARNAAEKDLVTKLVSDINGVRSVQNRMIVAP